MSSAALRIAIALFIGQAHAADWFSMVQVRDTVCSENSTRHDVQTYTFNSGTGLYTVVADGMTYFVPNRFLANVPNPMGHSFLWLNDDGTPRCFVR